MKEGAVVCALQSRENWARSDDVCVRVCPGGLDNDDAMGWSCCFYGGGMMQGRGSSPGGNLGHLLNESAACVFEEMLSDLLRDVLKRSTQLVVKKYGDEKDT